MRQLNGYSIRLEIFTSSYSIPRVKPPKTLLDFYGPDLNVAKVTGEILNATCKIKTLMSFYN